MARKSNKPGRAAARALGNAAVRLAVLIGWRRAGLAALVVLGPIVCINLLVAFCGSTVIFPLSPRHLGDKLAALGRYAAHRPHCFEDHPLLAPVVARVEARHRIPPGLLAALVQVESAGRPHRISPAGAMGQGQLAPSTARLLGVQDPFDTLENIEASGRYLAQQLTRFGEIRLAVAAYNAGPGAVAAVHAVPHNGETEVYVERVLRLHRSALALAARERARAVAVLPRARSAAAARPLSGPPSTPGAPPTPDEELPGSGAPSPIADGSNSDPGSARARTRRAIARSGTNSADAQRTGERKLNQRPRKKRRTSNQIPRRDEAAPLSSPPSDRLTLPRLAERAPP